MNEKNTCLTITATIGAITSPCMLGISFHDYLSSDDELFQKKSLRTLLECQAVWIQIKTDNSGPNFLQRFSADDSRHLLLSI